VLLLRTLARQCQLSPVLLLRTLARQCQLSPVLLLRTLGWLHNTEADSWCTRLLQVLDTVEIKPPKIPVYSNVSATPFTSAAEIKHLLGKQLVQPVLWENVLKDMLLQNRTKLFELGPGQQIKAMMRRINTDVWKSFKNVAA
jgi:malonyl CoA-acyl carrier protein transacylase